MSNGAMIIACAVQTRVTMSELHIQSFLQTLVPGLSHPVTACIAESPARPTHLVNIPLYSPWAPHARTGLIYGFSFEARCIIRRHKHMKPEEWELAHEDWRGNSSDFPCRRHKTHSIALPSYLCVAWSGRSKLFFGKSGWLIYEIWNEEGIPDIDEPAPTNRALRLFGDLLSSRQRLKIRASATARR